MPVLYRRDRLGSSVTYWMGLKFRRRDKTDLSSIPAKNQPTSGWPTMDNSSHHLSE